jgi:hypothetical protein
MSQEEFSRAFSKSPMKRAKLRGLKRNAAVVLGNVGTREDRDVLSHALDDGDLLVREHVAWALARLETRGAVAARSATLGDLTAPSSPDPGDRACVAPTASTTVRSGE